MYPAIGALVVVVAIIAASLQTAPTTSVTEILSELLATMDGSLRAIVIVTVFAAAAEAGAPYALHVASIPTTDPEVVIEGRFTGAEGLTFSHEGRLFIAADRAIWEVTPDRATRRVAADGRSLYVAQLFRSAPTAPPPARYEDFSNIVWRLPLRDGQPAGAPEELFRTRDAGTGPDGLAVDELGRIYLSAARAGELWRYDPRTGARELLAVGVSGLASLAFGQGAFDRRSLYATQIRGGRLLRFPIGVGGAPLSK